MDTSDIDPEESELLVAEAVTLFTGLVQATGSRIVDPPWTVRRAEDKLLQLVTALRLGVRVPETLVTNSPPSARLFSRDGPVLAKPVSYGSGLAPYADVVSDDLLELLVACPTLLQRSMNARADLRIVTVGSDAFAWRRARHPGEPVDWRSADPTGAGFTPIESDNLTPVAIRLAEQLGLTFSVQDWLETDADPTFLEVNPQGQWLFLRDATKNVAPALASLLFKHQG